MASIFGLRIPGTKKMSPTKEAGVSGTAVWGGYVENIDKNPRLSVGQRYKTAADILANLSIVAASVRYFMLLLSNPKWQVEPADDSPQAREMADFVESTMDDMVTSWPRVVRRVGMYKFYGFSINEWTAKRRDDGLVGFEDIESRPQHTIERWERDDSGTVLGVFQRNPQNGEDMPIDRWKFIYLVDDTLTDSPEGMGWFRHLVEPASRLKEYLNLEKQGYERDLAGIPVGRAPITAINRAVKAGTLSKPDADAMIRGLKDFVQTKIKQSNTGIVLDSQTFETQTADGAQVSGVAQWGIELLTGDPGSIQELGETIRRLNLEMARVIGTENILTGEDGNSLALSKDKSNNLYLQVTSTLREMADTFTSEYIGSLWALNGFDPDLMPRFTTENVEFKDIEQIAGVIRDMAQAGAILAPDDPAIDELRAMLGISPQEVSYE